MKVYIICYYDVMFNEQRIDKVFKSVIEADRFCEIQNNKFPELRMYWVEREVE